MLLQIADSNGLQGRGGGWSTLMKNLAMDNGFPLQQVASKMEAVKAKCSGNIRKNVLIEESLDW